MNESPTLLAEPTCPPEAAEAHAELVGLARGRTGRIPAELLARHVLAVYGSAEWPVQRAALEALLRRIGFAKRDGLRVAGRPRRGPFGLYRTRRPRREARPWRTLLESLQPVRGSCGCPDFRRGSLGLCKHLLVVLDELASRPRTFARALEAAAPPSPRAGLAWDPIRPLLGPGDWMERVVFRPSRDGRSARSVAERDVARRFARRVGDGACLRSTFAGDARRRLELVEALAGFLRARGRRGEVDPALSARLEDERERLERLVALRRAAPRLGRTRRSLKRRLYPYQEEGVKRFLAEGRLVLADDMGLGKTAQAIASCHALFRTGLVSRGLVVVPASLKHQWKREWTSFSDAPVDVVDGSPSERAAWYRRRPKGFLVANYEQVLRDLEHMQTWRPDLVVLDEAQRIKNWAAKTSHRVKELRPPYRLILTGTPMENRLEELASLFDWVDDHALEPKWRLVPFHADLADGRRAVVGARHLDVLRRRIGHCTVRRLRRDILRQLPARTDTLVPVPLTAEQQEQHDELRRPIASLLAIRQRRSLRQSEFLQLMQLLNTQRILANGVAQSDFASVWPAISSRRPTARLLRGLFSPKLAELRELVQQLAVDQGRKVVVFSQWRRMLRLARWAVADLLEENGLDARFFTGAEGARRRTQNLVDFHDDERVRLLFATDAGGVGLNLQRAANACVHLELPWNPAVFEQRVGRIHRLGQTEPIDVYALIGAGSIEERIARLVSDKRELFHGLFDGESDAVRFESAGTFLEGVVRPVEEGDGAVPGPSASAAEEDDDDDLGEPAEREIDEVVAAADESADAEPASTPALPGTAEVRDLFSQLAVERTEKGSLRIEAPPEAAASLAALFEGMASLLAEASRR